ncbi:hypothetical protein ACLOJK_038899 [Asimina triloba]
MGKMEITLLPLNGTYRILLPASLIWSTIATDRITFGCALAVHDRMVWIAAVEEITGEDKGMSLMGRMVLPKLGYGQA